MDNGYHLNVVMINPSILELSVKNPSPILMWNDQIKEAAIEIEILQCNWGFPDIIFNLLKQPYKVGPLYRSCECQKYLYLYSYVSFKSKPLMVNSKRY